VVVDGDPLLRELVSEALPLVSRRFEVAAAADPAAARKLAAADPPDVLMTELVFGGRRLGPEGLAALREAAPRAALLVLTAAPEAALREPLDYDGLLVKPPEMELLARRLDQLVARHRASVVRGIELPSVLQLLAAEGKSGVLTVEARGQAGTLALAGGRVVDAETARGRGREALFEMLAWREPVLVILAGQEPPRRTIDEPLAALLLEAALRRDHGELPGTGC
jgi:DNA-binding response OmpR family regulator